MGNSVGRLLVQTGLQGCIGGLTCRLLGIHVGNAVGGFLVNVGLQCGVARGMMPPAEGGIPLHHVRDGDVRSVREHETVGRNVRDAVAAHVQVTAHAPAGPGQVVGRRVGVRPDVADQTRGDVGFEHRVRRSPRRLFRIHVGRAVRDLLVQVSLEKRVCGLTPSLLGIDVGDTVGRLLVQTGLQKSVRGCAHGPLGVDVGDTVCDLLGQIRLQGRISGLACGLLGIDIGDAVGGLLVNVGLQCGVTITTCSDFGVELGLQVCVRGSVVAPQVGLVPGLTILDFSATHGIRCGDEALAGREGHAVDLDLEPAFRMAEGRFQRHGIRAEVEAVHPVLHRDDSDVLAVHRNGRQRVCVKRHPDVNVGVEGVTGCIE